MAEIIKCDGCKLTSPDQEGLHIANHWVLVQWSRNHLDYECPASGDRFWNKLIFCQDCFDKLKVAGGHDG